MKLRVSALFAAVLSVSAAVQANDPNVIVPDSSVVKPQDRGLFAHTNHLIYIGPGHNGVDNAPLLTELFEHGPAALQSPQYYVPSQLQKAYENTTSPGGSGIIAIVDAFNDRNALSDFNAFASAYGLPQETSKNVTSSSNLHFQIVYASGSKPSGNAGWAQEEDLDIEWAHAMAPNAKIVLVEARSSAYTDLFSAVTAAEKLGPREVSMSWGGGEFSGETAYDSDFKAAPGVAFFGASGDSYASPEYPSESPYVVGVGGTSLTLNNGNYGSEVVWNNASGGSGGGVSALEGHPSWQTNLSGNRETPDISADADPNTGVIVVYNGRGYIFGGTSVATPVCAGISNAGGLNKGSSLTTGEDHYIYGEGTAAFHAVPTGSPGWRLYTGWGSPLKLGSL